MTVASTWVAVSRDPDQLKAWLRWPGNALGKPGPAAPRVWTDDHASILPYVTLAQLFGETMTTAHPDTTIIGIHGKSPRIHSSAFIAPGCRIIGDVEIGPDAAIWYNCVLRADVNRIVDRRAQQHPGRHA
jgi:hypothetical protein